MENNDCNNAVLRMVLKIDMNKIIALFDEIPEEYNGLSVLNKIQRNFYLKSLEYKYNNVLIPTYDKLK